MADEQQRLGNIRSVAVIGAGISGILATKYLLEAGLDVTVFERHEKPGGVWSVEIMINSQVLLIDQLTNGKFEGCTTRERPLSLHTQLRSPWRQPWPFVHGTKRTIKGMGLFPLRRL
jgi:cation diffusion facilitator CzcD-associated flavoprotein CzcO